MFVILLGHNNISTLTIRQHGAIFNREADDDHSLLALAALLVGYTTADEGIPEFPGNPFAEFRLTSQTISTWQSAIFRLSVSVFRLAK
jgi:hypothetical protein